MFKEIILCLMKHYRSGIGFLVVSPLFSRYCFKYDAALFSTAVASAADVVP